MSNQKTTMFRVDSYNEKNLYGFVAGGFLHEGKYFNEDREWKFCIKEENRKKNVVFSFGMDEDSLTCHAFLIGENGTPADDQDIMIWDKYPGEDWDLREESDYNGEVEGVTSEMIDKFFDELVGKYGKTLEAMERRIVLSLLKEEKERKGICYETGF